MGWRKVLCLVLRVGIGSIFVFASLGKIIDDPLIFVSVVESYRVLPEAFIPIFSIVLPWVEFIAGILLIIGYAVESAAAVIALMLVAFIIGITVNLFRGVEMACGCFGFLEGGDKIGWHTVLRNIAMLLSAMVLVFANVPFASIENLFSKMRKRSDEHG
ncbi:MAG: MauE/DoxX family redox-associated membrane protein [Armatimonadota bacterium]|nr:DoxX family membrane protein [Armatimonadota bacterium]MCX7778220.1 DoxX family membrane protein [Armatimonadota bacterium]MDW8024486.1 MauE/DoxX family redox-associated membrane protein [Armatimonadota bacterium]